MKSSTNGTEWLGVYFEPRRKNRKRAPRKFRAKPITARVCKNIERPWYGNEAMTKGMNQNGY